MDMNPGGEYEWMKVPVMTPEELADFVERRKSRIELHFLLTMPGWAIQVYNTGMPSDKYDYIGLLWTDEQLLIFLRNLSKEAKERLGLVVSSAMEAFFKKLEEDFA